MLKNNVNKDLIKRNFQKSIETYNNNAIVQKKMAQKLAELLKRKKYDNILEIGSYSGLLTEKIVENIEFKSFLALDIVDSFNNIKHLSKKINFLQADIETLNLNEKFDLIVSSATLQWCEDFKETIKKIRSYLKPDGTLAIAIFGQNNLIEIRQSYNVGLNYPSNDELREIFLNAKIIEEVEILEFENPIGILKHLKLTGVNSLKNTMTIAQIKNGLKKIGNKLTYHPVWIMENN